MRAIELNATLEIIKFRLRLIFPNTINDKAMLPIVADMKSMAINFGPEITFALNTLG
jgi:hypothetical protein